jgi:hypothetical protein
MTASDGPILTLEPLIEAVRAGVEGGGWELSGLQKTTSHQFEGRWEGESTRSAYVFFHPAAGPDNVSVDVYLDETSRGLTGNLALVADLADLGAVGNPEAVLAFLGAASAGTLSGAYRRPVTLRFRLDDAAGDTEGAETEVRIKVRIPRRTIASGAAAVTDFAAEVLGGFAELLAGDSLTRYFPLEAG